MSNLKRLIEQLEAKIPSFELSNERISAASVGWQIEHCLLVINKITLVFKTQEQNTNGNLTLKRF